MGWGPRGRARTTLDRRHLIEEDTFEQTSEREGRTRTDRTGKDRLVQDECRCLKKWPKKAEEVAITPASDQLQICTSHDTRQNHFPGGNLDDPVDIDNNIFISLLGNVSIFIRL